ncbi:MAG: hypothetical protein J0M29_06075 [Chitinophagales bacterium]|nr:hypothetical protein [Chitinophagales bacterium]
MSKKLFFIPTFILGAFLLFTPSCADNCKDVDCGTGVCVDGTCECGDGFEGTNCETEWSAKFVGSFLGADVVTASTAGTDLGTYNLTKPAVVTRKSEVSISISNFGGFDSFVDATLTSSDEISINYTDPAGRKFVGTGKISGNVLSGNYVVTYSDNTTDTATFSYTK